MPTFAYDADIKSGKASGIHATLNPSGVKVRESRDSDSHPEAVPVAVPFDVTGSMSGVPRIVQAKLPQLMGLLIKKGYLEHPAIMVGAIGDAFSDTYPFQIGQFESGIEIEENLTNLILEGGGGGQNRESYEIALYFLARKTVHDHYEKRGQKGYAFITGDEMPYEVIRKDQIQRVIGDTLEADIPIRDIISETQERYHLYFIMPAQTAHYNDRDIRQKWKDLLSENVIFLDDPSAIAETIAAQIGMCEGVGDTDKIVDDLIDVGTSTTSAKAVGRSLVTMGSGGGRGRGSVQKVSDSGAASGLTPL